MRRLTEIWAGLRSSLWFLPLIMFISSLLLALGFVSLDVAIDTQSLRNSSPVFAISSDGARAMLLAVAGSMLTVVALAFTLTLNAITHASGQFSPRILRNFMRDRSNQFVLGYFVGIFGYSLLAALSIRSGESVEFVPVLTALAGLVITLGGVLVLIYFIHHISSSLQVTTIIDRIVYDTRVSIDHMFPTHLGDAANEAEIDAAKLDEEQNWTMVTNQNPGYIQNVSTERLMDYTAEHDIIIRMEYRIGHFIPCGANLMAVAKHPSSDKKFAATDEHIKKLNEFFTIGRHRMIEQDTGFGIRQIVDIALKALSPGMNDTSTAVNCVQYLGDLTGELARQEFPSTLRSHKGKLRMIADAPTFEDYIEDAYDQIRINGEGNIAIFMFLIRSLGYVTTCTDDPERLRVIKNQLGLVEEFAQKTLQTPYEKDKVSNLLKETREKMG